MGSLLIVEDGLTTRMGLADAFEDLGWTPHPVQDLREARVALASNSDLSLVSLDLNLPDGDGIDLLRAIRADHRLARLSVMVVSDEIAIQHRLRALRAGANEYHAKVGNLAQVALRGHHLLGAIRANAKPTVLLVDDSPTVRGALREELEAAGLIVFEASDGESGLRMARTVRPDTTVVDQMMPGMNGITFVRRLRSDVSLQRVPCLLLTGQGGRQIELDGLDSGADGFLHKSEPFDVIVARVLAAVKHGISHAREAPVATRALMIPHSSPSAHSPARRLVERLRDEDFDVAVGRCTDGNIPEWLGAQSVDVIIIEAASCACLAAAGAVFSGGIPVVVLGGPEQSMSVRELLARGADDYVRSDEDLNLIVARIRAQVRRKQAQDAYSQPREALERAVAADRAKSTFLANMSHELRTPLNAVIGYAEMLREEEDDPEKSHDLARITDAGKHLLSLINDVLDISKIAAGHLQLAPAPIDMRELFRAIRSLLEPLAATNTNALDVIVDPSVSEHLLADPLRLKQIIVNLGSNACKFTHEGVVSIHISESDGSLAIVVTDTGIGIPPSSLSTIFEPFVQADASTTRRFGGTGLGLSITRDLVRMMGGEIHIESVEGQGSTFRVVLPVVRLSAAA